MWWRKKSSYVWCLLTSVLYYYNNIYLENCWHHRRPLLLHPSPRELGLATLTLARTDSSQCSRIYVRVRAFLSVFVCIPRITHTVVHITVRCCCGYSALYKLYIGHTMAWATFAFLCLCCCFIMGPRHKARL